MKLSEAIRLGAMMKRQCFGQMFDGAIGSCALGAAADAVNFKGIWVAEAFPLLHARARCPLGDLHDPYRVRVANIVQHLNDDHRWTREQIADWVATVEESETERVEEAPSVDAVRLSMDEPVVSTRV